MKKNLLSLLFLLSLVAPGFAITDVCSITVSPDSKVAAFANGEDVTVYLSYTTDQPAGVRIYVRPYSNGSLSPNYTADASPIYYGSGVANSSFTISSGDVMVDEIRVEVYKSDNSTLLRRLWIPVQHHFGQNGVHNFTYSHSPNLSSFLLNEKFTTYFKYNINYPGGARIYVRPYTNGALTPDYYGSGSAVFSGSGSASAYIYIQSGKNVHVDELRVRIVSPDQSVIIDEFFVPVNLYYSTIKITGIHGQAGNYVSVNTDRTISYNYSTTEPEGVRIYPRPFTNGALTPDYAVSGSPMLTGSGSSSNTVTVKSYNKKIDHMRFVAKDEATDEVLLEMYHPIEYTFGNFLIDNIQLCPSPNVRMLNGPKVNINYDFKNNANMSARVFVTPFTNGSPTSGAVTSISPLHNVGSGSESAYFSINIGNAIVDQLRFRVTNGDQSQLIADYFIPVHYVFGDATTPVIEVKDIVSDIQIFPNPTVNDANLEVQVKEDQTVQVMVLDLSGRVLLDLGTRDLNADSPEQWQIPTASLANGSYLVRVEGNAFKTVKKLVVLKQ